MANNDASSDADLDLKKRARRRLVGATALALFGVVVLSITMEQSPGPRLSGGDSPEIVIPSSTKKTEFPSEIKPLSAPAPSPVAIAGVPPAPVPSNPAPMTAQSGLPMGGDGLKKDDVKSVSQIQEKAPVASPAKSAAVEKPAEIKSVTKVAEKSSEKTAKKVEEAKATAALEGKSGGQWVVQLGAYQAAGNVKLLLGKLKEMGVPVYTEKLDSPQGPRTRVRAGPFASRDAAEKAQGKIRKIGVDGPVAQK